MRFATAEADFVTKNGRKIQVLFPATEGEVVATPENIHAEADWCGSGTVLLVDDSTTVRTIGTTMLKRLGMTVLVACDGRQWAPRARY